MIEISLLFLVFPNGFSQSQLTLEFPTSWRFSIMKYILLVVILRQPCIIARTGFQPTIQNSTNSKNTIKRLHT